MPQIVLITGCSTGIGRDLAQRLTQAGYTVVATARHAETLNDLQAALKLSLDVSQPDSVNAAVAHTIQQFGRIDVLVNNAGYAVRGALEEVPEEQIRQIFDVNVFGVLRMVRAVVPHMRKQGAGHIINLSSSSGKLVNPANGVYSATKFALKALSAALRLELTPFGIQVVVVNPGATKTHFNETAHAHAQDILSNSASPYQPLYQKFDRFMATRHNQAHGPEIVSDVIQQSIETRRPKACYLVAVSLPERLTLLLRDFIWDPVMRRVLKIEPPKGKSDEQKI